jgi:hypothetical protein
MCFTYREIFTRLREKTGTKSGCVRHIRSPSGESVCRQTALAKNQQAVQSWNLPLRVGLVVSRGYGNRFGTQELMRHSSPVMEIGTCAQAVTSDKRVARSNLAAQSAAKMVGTSGLEPLTSSVSIPISNYSSITYENMGPSKTIGNNPSKHLLDPRLDPRMHWRTRP